ncbi:hypothetical protein WR25_24805 [Diploscapter pachys]|uniref:CCAAT-binding factor domain-containing protein n=1 Tax=Diploscapter pachys TaxID=2018661 RepID=A0A2A2KCB9_9BILA|nr:hypothetical protein WR25_24805 [Diploscapter pachys]
MAAQLLSIYFGLFKTIVANGKIDPKLLNILLTAANRAFPYAAEKAESLIDDIDALYRLVHTGTYAISLHTLRLLFQFHQVSESLSDRFFTALYRKLLDPIPPSAYNQLLLLVYKAMKMDSSSDRVRTFVKRLLQIATTATPSLATGILILISKTMEARKDKSLIILRREPERNPVLLNSNDDEEEKYFDVDSDSEVTTPNSKSNVKKEEMGSDEDVKPHKKSAPNNSVGWVHRSAKGKMRDPYDPSARNPLFVSCSEIADNELYLLSKHFHPSVAAFANSLIERGVINYKGDPLTDFSLMHFLDRFAFRNPKSKNKPKVEKVIKKKAYDPWGVRGMSIKSAEYLNKQDSELPADERFLHRYAKSNIRLPEKKDKEDDDEWETRSVDSEEFEALLEKFEAGEKNDEFFDDTDFGEVFSAEKKKRVEKRKPEDDVDADELDLEGTDDDDLEDEQEGDMDDDDSEEESDVEMESDISDDDGGFRRQTTKGDDDNDDDWDMDSEGEVDDDANMAGEMFANLLDEEQEEKSEKKKKNRDYKNKSKSKGKR